MTYKIKKVPFIAHRASPEREEIYATAALLEVGESFVIPKELWFTSVGQNLEKGRCRGRKFITRKVEKGHRIIRTA